MPNGKKKQGSNGPVKRDTITQTGSDTNLQLNNTLQQQQQPPHHTPSRIPISTVHKRIGSLEQLKPSAAQQQQNHHHNKLPHRSLTSYCLGSHQLLPELPQEVKLMHMVHCHCSHTTNGNMLKSKANNEMKNGTRNNHNANANKNVANSTVPTNCCPSVGSFTPKGRRSSHSSTHSSSNQSKRSKNKYDEYMPLCEMQKGLEKGEIVEGILRINPKNFNDAYISAPERGLDIFVEGLSGRNRALNGDQVAVKLLSVDTWKISYAAIESNWTEWESLFEPLMSMNTTTNDDGFGSGSGSGSNAASNNLIVNQLLKEEFPTLPCEIFSLPICHLMCLQQWPEFIQRKGKVVQIIEQKHTRLAGGHIKLPFKEQNGGSGGSGNNNKEHKYCHLMPNDHRVPQIILPLSSLPQNFIHNYTQMKNQLFLVKITNWAAYSFFPCGELLQVLGNTGDIEAETQLLLQSHDIDDTEFPEEALQEYNLFSEQNWTIPVEEFEYRQDFRNHCVFTIDPQSARDLDDAISYRELDDGLLEIGVHIADVSYFIKENTLLDSIAQKRATSVYLVNRVIPMLPHLFCQNLCSLNPGEDKLTFSVVFTMDQEGNILDKWIGRTIIKSACKLSYEHAQRMIESYDDDDSGAGVEGPLNVDEYPQIYGNWSLAQIVCQVRKLNRMTRLIRQRRFECGSIRLDKTKLSFQLNDEGLPISFSKHVLRESNQLIEELMLLANKAVAERLYDCFAQEGRAFLRRHPLPSLKSLQDFAKFCKLFSIDFDMSNSLAMHDSLKAIQNNSTYFSICSLNLIKAMKLAEYCVVNGDMTPSEYHHFALNFSKYTHFTSPIRRYADVIVHRLLSTNLGYSSPCTLSASQLHSVANNCNKKKYLAYLVSEGSSEIYLKAYIAKLGTFVTNAIVYAVNDKSFDVLVPEFDLVSRVYMNQLALEKFRFYRSNGFAQLQLCWSPLDGNGNGSFGGGNKKKQLNNNSNNNLEQIIVALQQLEVQISITDQFKYRLLIPHPNGEYIPITNA